mmetsp:Transcript_34905/g.70581  ORF Transcript_34905/g.70581 Transcript_34905/m.70581 type:complete len:158 (+) Transcript_34905:951-1424(+)
MYPVDLCKGRGHTLIIPQTNAIPSTFPPPPAWSSVMSMSSNADMEVGGGDRIVFSCHEEMNPTRRSTMEDVAVTLQPGEWESSSYALAGVYDGHGGTYFCEGWMDISTLISSPRHFSDGLEQSTHTSLLSFPFLRTRHCGLPGNESLEEHRSGTGAR